VITHMTLSDLLRFLALVCFVVALLISFTWLTFSGDLYDALGWVSTGLAFWVASTFGYVESRTLRRRR